MNIFGWKHIQNEMDEDYKEFLRVNGLKSSMGVTVDKRIYHTKPAIQPINTQITLRRKC